MLVLAAIAVLVVGLRSGATRAGASTAMGVAPAVLRGTDVFPPGMRPALPFALHDQYGQRLTLSNLRGHIVALTFLDSHCTRECPVAGAELAATQRLLGTRSALELVVISVNPEADTPASARAFIRKIHYRGTWHWLLGTRRQLQPVWNEYGIQVQRAPGDILHTAAVYLMDRRGAVRVADAVPFLPRQLAGSVQALAHGA